MNALGSAALAASLLVALYAAVAAIHGARTRDRRWVDSSRWAAYGLAALLTLSVIAIEAAFLRDDFSLAVVIGHSSIDTPTHFKLTAMWSSQEGSLLLWAWVLSLASAAVLFMTRRRHREIVPWATAVLMGLGAFFVSLMLFAADPFAATPEARIEAARMAGVQLDGAGLAPLLRNGYMTIHPPMLYSGYVLFAIPFAFAIGALITRRLDASWIRSTRRFALAAWVFLGIGLLLGSRWSYEELGWGGYWGWDPVENAALMPWLVGTAFIHSIMVQERRGMLKVWNVSLICATFALSLLGTFLVRSGILDSIHAFGESTVGTPLLILIATVMVGSATLIVGRLDSLRSERRISSAFSREGVFLINNLLLVGLAAVIFWGTFFPLISELFTGTRSSLGPPWFDRLVTPIGVALVLFTGIGPLLSWGRLSRGAALRLLGPPAAAATATAVVLGLFTAAGDDLWALLLFSLAAFTAVGLGQEFHRAGSARAALTGDRYARALPAAVGRNRRRYGGYLVHIGIATLLVGIAASSSFQTNEDVRLGVGESAQVDDYRLTYERLTPDLANERIAFTATLSVQRDGERFATLAPARNYYRSSDPSVGPIGSYFNGEATSEIGLRAGAGEDFWTAFQPDLSVLDEAIERGNARFAGDAPEVQASAIAGLAFNYASDPPPATFRVIVNPLVSWLWIGALIAIGGALFALWPTAGSRRRADAAYAARLGRELSRA